MAAADGPKNLEETYAQALEDGRLDFQRCQACGKAWLPPREDCPACLADSWSWETASGGGRLVTWTVYHIAYRPELAGRLPYNVAVVELDEGPRLVTNILNPDDHGGLEIERPVRLAITRPEGMAIATFEIVSSAVN